MRTPSDSADVYLAVINRLEPEVTMIDRDAALASIAISLKRIADALSEPNAHMVRGVSSSNLLRGLGNR